MKGRKEGSQSRGKKRAKKADPERKTEPAHNEEVGVKEMDPFPA